MAAIFRDRPYGQFNFRVDLGADNPGVDDFKAGFQEVGGLGAEIHVAEYRPGNHKDPGTMKVTGTSKTNDITLKRGLIGDPATLFGWWDLVRSGDQNQLRTVKIQQMDEAGNGPVQEWVLTNARPIKYTGPALTGKGTDLSIEELVLSAERIDITGIPS
ncbi:MAG TPA: phage tail protein [Candidatus Acidoferrales bacterium]|nr:phage tail protein [Candidatus Acidoferrales bacterium]HXK05939.1 phage tail protein [Verrucomicrobiae bacterium]